MSLTSEIFICKFFVASPTTYIYQRLTLLKHLLCSKLIT